MDSTRNKSDSHAGTLPRGNVHGTQSSGMEFESQKAVVATNLTRNCFTFDTATVFFIQYVTHVTNQTSMQAHGQEEMFMGHNQVG